MAARLPISEDSSKELKALLKTVRTKDGYRRVLCLWLRHAMGMSARQVATAVGWSHTHVRDVQGRYLREGEAALVRPGRGGRRHEVLTLSQEDDLLRGLREEAWPGNTLDFCAVFQAMEEAAGRSLAPSTVHRMLVRRGWGRRSTVTVARQKERPSERATAPTATPDSPLPDSSSLVSDARGRPGTRRSGAWQPLREEDGVGDEGREPKAEPGPKASSQ
jgi:transposase